MLRYAIVSELSHDQRTASGPFHFAINRTTGWLTVQRSLDYEAATNFTLVVKATDQSPSQRNATATVMVTVVNVNEYRPVVPVPQHLTLPENEPVNRVIYTAVAQDQDGDIFGRIRYAFLLPNSSLSQREDMFIVDPSRGEVMLTRSLDYEVQSSYELTIRCTDTAGHPDGLFSDLQLNITITVSAPAPLFFA